ncbi:PepSY domain-containing protein [Desulfosporosinus acidiphilus]|nr:PepSY domain-containing protein [Desulfosporosinus acidiphilus]
MASLISMAFFLQITASPVLAAEQASGTTIPVVVSPVMSLPTISLEKAIEIVKHNFDIPSDLTNFTSNFSTSDDRQAWSLHWNNTDKPGDFMAEVNAVNGDIISINNWKDETSTTSSSISVVTKEDARKICDTLLNRLLGQRAQNMKLLNNDQQIVPINTYGPVTYNFQYQRLVNDIPFTANGANVQVSGSDGHIISYNLNWSDVKFPDSKDVISETQAKEAFTASPFFKLQYWTPEPYRILSAGQKLNAKLVYQLVSPSGGAIDALTGEPLTLNSGDWLAETSMSGGMGGKGDAAGSASSAAQNLTPQEQREVANTAKLLKQDEAIAAVKRWISIPDELTLRSANLSTDWRSADNRVWSFDWFNANRDNSEGQAQYMSARIDASTGELLGFNRSYQSTAKSDSKLDKTAMQKIAENFLQKVQPNKFSQVTLDTADSPEQMKIAEPVGTGSFIYHRVVNGIDFPNNIMAIRVEPSDGTITNYDLNWSNLDFPNSSGILTKDQAVEAFLKNRPMTLTYVRIFSNGIPGDVRLVYLPKAKDQSNQSFNILDAMSGELLNFQGETVDQGPQPYEFSDITGVVGEQEISALGEAGLFGDFGSSFKPNEKMTLGSLLRAMYLSRYGVWQYASLSDSEIITRAKDQGWLKENLQPKDQVSRDLLCKILLRFLQLNKLAELKNIYQVNFQDSSDIPTADLGYVAVATGTGIVQVKGQSFAPNEVVDRAEAAGDLFRALTWRS